MHNKEKLREKYIKIRKKNYFEVNDNFFKPILSFLKNSKKKSTKVSLYYPTNYEVNTLKFFEICKFKKNIITLLPSIKPSETMKFYRWNYLDVLKVNKYGILEPSLRKKVIVPDLILVPLLSKMAQLVELRPLSNYCCSLTILISQILLIPSQSPETIFFPSALNFTVLTALLCP